MSGWSEAFPTLHRALAPQYRGLPQEHVESIVHGVFGPSVGLADAENFFNDIGRSLTQAGRAAAPIAGPALQGAVTGGASLAPLGPYAALAGAIGGGVMGALGAAQAPRTPAAPRPPMPAAAAAPPIPPMVPPPPIPPTPGAAPAAPPVPGAEPATPPIPGAAPAAPPGLAVHQLLAALASPTVQDAVSALLMGRAGSPAVAGAGGEQLSTPAIMNMLGMLTGRAAAEAEAWESDGEGIALPEGIDEADPEARADWVYGRLAAPETDAEALSTNGGGEGWLDAMYDELEAEFYAEALVVDDGELDG
jgi:hypothetical protein